MSVAVEAVRQLREMADARGVEIRVTANPCTVVVDVARIELIFINLMSNADQVLRSRQGPTATSRCRWRRSDAERECAVIVRDNGIGIAVDSVNAVFNQFFRAHADRDDELGVDGAGLGLSIVADCVQAIGGQISVESTVGAGTEFTIVLPRPAPERA